MQEVFEKIIQRLRTEKNMDRSLVYSTEQCDAIRYAFGAAIDAVKVCVEEYNNGWIPCSERLPECENGCETTALMFQLKTGTIEVGYFGVGGKVREKYFRHYRNSTDGVDASDVVAWKPLPEPYQPKGE